jgi:hypothetical protein
MATAICVRLVAFLHLAASQCTQAQTVRPETPLHDAGQKKAHQAKVEPARHQWAHGWIGRFVSTKEEVCFVTYRSC